MLTKLTSKNRLTLPRQALDAIGPASHSQVEVEVDGDRLVLTPERMGAVDAWSRKRRRGCGPSSTPISSFLFWPRSRRAAWRLGKWFGHALAVAGGAHSSFYNLGMLGF